MFSPISDLTEQCARTSFSSPETPKRPCLLSRDLFSSPQLSDFSNCSQTSSHSTSPEKEWLLEVPIKPVLRKSHTINLQNPRPKRTRVENSNSLPASVSDRPTPTDEKYEAKLPLQRSKDLLGVNVVSPQTVYHVLRGHYDGLFDRIVIVDCRFDFEYKGGHIDGAIHVKNSVGCYKFFFPGFFDDQVDPGSSDQEVDLKQALLNVLPNNLDLEKSYDRVAFIFHCEFSQKRAPDLYRLIRGTDRDLHGLAYFPKLFFPEIYVMEGGYKAFFEEFSTYCDPCGYIPMSHKDHASECRAKMARLRQEKNKRSRAID